MSIHKLLCLTQVYLNNAIAVESNWGKPEDMKFFHGYKKPILKTNRVAVALSSVAKPTSSPGARPFLLVTPQSITGEMLNYYYQTISQFTMFMSFYTSLFFDTRWTF